MRIWSTARRQCRKRLAESTKNLLPTSPIGDFFFCQTSGPTQVLGSGNNKISGTVQRPFEIPAECCEMALVSICTTFIDDQLAVRSEFHF